MYVGTILENIIQTKQNNLDLLMFQAFVCSMVSILDFSSSGEGLYSVTTTPRPL